MAVFRIRYKEWILLPESNLAEGPFFRIYTEEDRPIRSVHALLGSSSDIQSLKHEIGLQGPESDKQVKRIVIRYAIQLIEQKLRENAFPNPQSNKTDCLSIERDAHQILRQLSKEKTCDYQIKERRDLLCTAPRAGDRTARSHRQFNLVAPTTQALCHACELPDTDYLCSHFAHPKIQGYADHDGVMMRQLVTGMCNIDKSEVRQHPECCRAGGHECWERLIEFVQPIIPTAPPALPEAMVARIFLCHASEDKPQVYEVYHQLKVLGFTPWLDKEDIFPGQEWAQEIPRALRTSDFVLIFLSRTSVAKRGYVQREMKLALDILQEIPEDTIHTIPVKLDNCDVPESFRRYQWGNLFDSNGLDRIIYAIRTELAKRPKTAPQPPTTDQSEESLNVYSEAETLSFLPRSTADILNDRQCERTGEKFSVIHNNHPPHPYTRQEVDRLTPTQRERLFVTDPEMKNWWRGKAMTNGAWPLFRIQGGTWISKEQIKQVPLEQRVVFWEIRDLLEWYMRDEVF